jgi:cytochrome P450
MYGDHSMLLAQPGPYWNEQRKVFRKALGPQVVPSYDDIIGKNLSTLLTALSGFSGDIHPTIVE